MHKNLDYLSAQVRMCHVILFGQCGNTLSFQSLIEGLALPRFGKVVQNQPDV